MGVRRVVEKAVSHHGLLLLLLLMVVMLLELLMLLWPHACPSHHMSWGAHGTHTAPSPQPHSPGTAQRHPPQALPHPTVRRQLLLRHHVLQVGQVGVGGGRTVRGAGGGGQLFEELLRGGLPRRLPLVEALLLLRLALGEVLQGAAGLIRRHDAGQVKLGDARVGRPDDLAQIRPIAHGHRREGGLGRVQRVWSTPLVGQPFAEQVQLLGG